MNCSDHVIRFCTTACSLINKNNKKKLPLTKKWHPQPKSRVKTRMFCFDVFGGRVPWITLTGFLGFFFFPELLFVHSEAGLPSHEYSLLDLRYATWRWLRAWTSPSIPREFGTRRWGRTHKKKWCSCVYRWRWIFWIATSARTLWDILSIHPGDNWTFLHCSETLTRFRREMGAHWNSWVERTKWVNPTIVTLDVFRNWLKWEIGLRATVSKQEPQFGI